MRGYQARSAYVLSVQALIIQTKWRQFGPHRAYRQYRAALRVQTLWRMKKYSTIYAQFIAARRIQLCWRCSRDCSAFNRLRGTIRIQTIWRCKTKFHAYTRYRAAVRIQKNWRMCSAHAWYRDYISARRIQSAWRGKFARTVFLIWYAETLAATMIQSSWRGFVCYTDYLLAMEDIIAIQTIARRYLARKESLNLRREKKENLAAAEIQRCFRGSQSRSRAFELRESIERQQAQQAALSYSSAVQIQKVIRGATARNRLTKERDAAIKIQTAYRRKMDRDWHACYQAATIIQTTWRAKSVRAHYREYIAARRIQSTWRGNYARTMLTICRAEDLAAMMIQSAWRGFLCYTDYLFTIGDIVMAQQIARRWLAQKKVAVLRRELAALDIQRCFRGYIDRSLTSELRMIAECERSAVAIQRIWRGHSSKEQFWYCLGCTMLIQKVTRGTLTRNQLSKEHAAATKINSTIRGFIVRRKYRNDQFMRMFLSSSAIETQALDKVLIIEQWWLDVRARREEAAITLQGWAKRQILAQKLQNYAMQIWCATMIQRWWGRMLFSRDLLEFVEALRELEAAEEEEARIQQSAARIQRWWRRRCARMERAEILRAHHRAANMIQGFFLMVKAMVDREIRAEKERRMERKRLKMIHITPETEDDLLESIWANTMEKKPKASTKSRRPSGVPRTTPRSSASVAGSSSDNRGVIRRFKANPNLVSSRDPPVRYSNQARDNDERSMCSQSTASRSTISRPVPSRLTTYSPKELIDDVSLEEAWIDVEISQLKEQQRSKKSSRRSKQSAL